MRNQASQVPHWGKKSICNAGDAGSIPGSGKSPGGHGNPLQYSCLEVPMDRGAWQARVHRVTKSQTQLKQLSTHARTHIRNVLTQSLVSLSYEFNILKMKIHRQGYFELSDVCSFKNAMYLTSNKVRFNCRWNENC